MKTLLVKAAPLVDLALVGKARVVKEGTTRRYITETDPVQVPQTAYYLRKLGDGELIRVDNSTPAANAATEEAWSQSIPAPTLPKSAREERRDREISEDDTARQYVATRKRYSFDDDNEVK